MDFRFSEAQESVRELAREILEKEATPERVKQAASEPGWCDEALWMQLAEANLLGLAVPQAFGGMGFGFLELCVLLEEIGRRTAPLPALSTLVLGGLPLCAFGSEAQRARWLPRLCSGRARFGAALRDAESGDASVPATRARRDGADFVLEGGKCEVPFAAGAELLWMPAAAEDGVGLFGVPASECVLTAKTTSTGEPLYDVLLPGVRVSGEARLGNVQDGLDVTRWLREHALVAMAALQAGVSAEALRITVDFVREREQFGVPIGSFQAVQHRCADAFIDLEAIRWTLWRAAWRLAERLPAAREAAVAKFWAAEGGARIAASALHLHGGLGSDVDYPIQRYFLWSKALELGLGGATPQLAWLGRDMARTGPQEHA